MHRESMYRESTDAVEGVRRETRMEGIYGIFVKEMQRKENQSKK